MFHVGKGNRYCHAVGCRHGKAKGLVIRCGYHFAAAVGNGKGHGIAVIGSGHRHVDIIEHLHIARLVGLYRIAAGIGKADLGIVGVGVDQRKHGIVGPEHGSDGHVCIGHRCGGIIAGIGHGDLNTAVLQHIVVQNIARIGGGIQDYGLVVAAELSRGGAALHAVIHTHLIADSRELVGDFHCDVGCRHGEGVAVVIVHHLTIAVVGYGNALHSIAGIGLGDHLHGGAGRRPADLAAQHLEAEAAVGSGLLSEAVGSCGVKVNSHKDLFAGHGEGVAVLQAGIDRIAGGIHNIDAGKGGACVGSGGDLDGGALDGKIHRHVVDGAGQTAAAVAPVSLADQVAVVEGGGDLNVALGHGEAAVIYADNCGFVRGDNLYSVQSLVCLGVGFDGNGAACGCRSDSLAAHGKAHGAAAAGAGLDGIGLGGAAGIATAGSRAAVVAAAGGGTAVVVTAGGRAAVVTAAGSDDGGHGHQESGVVFNVGQTHLGVKGLEQAGVGGVADAIVLADAVCSLALSDLVSHDRIAADACGGLDGGGQKQGLACGNAVPGRDVVDGLYQIRIGRKADAQGVAHAGDGLAALNGVGDQPISHITADIAGAAGSAAGRRACPAAHIGRGYFCRILIAGRQSYHLAHVQLPVLCLAGEIVQLVYGRLTGIEVQTGVVAYLKQSVSADDGVFEGIVIRISIGADGGTSKHGRHQKYCQKHTDEPFFHRLLPLTYPLWVELITVWRKNLFIKFQHCYDSLIILQQLSPNCKTYFRKNFKLFQIITINYVAQVRKPCGARLSAIQAKS